MLVRAPLRKELRELLMCEDVRAVPDVRRCAHATTTRRSSYHHSEEAAALTTGFFTALRAAPVCSRPLDDHLKVFFSLKTALLPLNITGTISTPSCKYHYQH